MPDLDQKEAKDTPRLLTRLRDHLRTAPAALTVVQQELAPYERPNLQLALEELLAAPGRSFELTGVVVPEEYHTVTLSKLSSPRTAGEFDEGPVEYVDVTLEGQRRLSCVRRGLYLIRDEGGPPLAVLLHEERYHNPNLTVEVMAAEPDRGEHFLARLSRTTRHGKAFRGQVLSLEVDCYGVTTVNFHRLPRISREAIILPERLLDRIERHTIRFSDHAARLRAAGRHLKRGILLHGPPGTGKTLCAMYLASRMVGRTVLLLTGAGMGSIERACRLARLLEPSTVILEDVDLIGTQRGHQTVDANALLFELLNEMDGLAEDADLLFILTTNRPDILEPALAARPGRIDQAIAIPLPDADCRRRLFELYGAGLRLRGVDLPRLIERTEGVSGAFIRELLRKAAVLAADAQPAGGDGSGAGADELVISDAHLAEALEELLVLGGELTRSLLGARVGADPTS